jgi:hypothetical protein
MVTVSEWLMQNLDMPAMVLLMIFVLGLYVLFRTQKSNATFDFADMLRDELGKPSAFRLAIFVCLAISSWAIMYMLVKAGGTIDPWIYVAYITVWSGAKVAEKALDAYSGKPSQYKAASEVNEADGPIAPPPVAKKRVS